MAEWTFQNDLSNEYEKIVYLKNLFMLLSGAAEKRYVEELTHLMKLCRRSHSSHEVMSTRHTNEVNITKSSSC